MLPQYALLPCLLVVMACIHGATFYAALFSFHIVIIVYTDSWFELYRFSNLVANTSFSMWAHVVAMRRALLVLTIQLRVVMLSAVYK